MLEYDHTASLLSSNDGADVLPMVMLPWQEPTDFARDPLAIVTVHTAFSPFLSTSPEATHIRQLSGDAWTRWEKEADSKTKFYTWATFKESCWPSIATFFPLFFFFFNVFPLHSSSVFSFISTNEGQLQLHQMTNTTRAGPRWTSFSALSPPPCLMDTRDQLTKWVWALITELI